MKNFRPGQRVYAAHPDEIEELIVVERGSGNFNLKRRIADPYVVRATDGKSSEWVAPSNILYTDTLAAGIRAAEMFEEENEEKRKKEDFAANPRPRFRNGMNDLGDGVKVWVSGDVPTSVTSSGDLRGRALAKKISDWFGTPFYLSNARWENGNYRADVNIDPLMRSNPQPWAKVFG
jgi:hypothetical protein